MGLPAPSTAARTPQQGALSTSICDQRPQRVPCCSGVLQPENPGHMNHNSALLAMCLMAWGAIQSDALTLRLFVIRPVGSDWRASRFCRT
jgi:hypothetical protein